METWWVARWIMPHRHLVEDRYAFGELDVAHAVPVAWRPGMLHFPETEALLASLQRLPLPTRKEGWLVGPMAIRLAILGPDPSENGGGAWQGWYAEPNVPVLRLLPWGDPVVREWRDARRQFWPKALDHQPPKSSLSPEALRLLRHMPMKPGPRLSGEMVRANYPTAWHRILWGPFGPFQEDF